MRPSHPDSVLAHASVITAVHHHPSAEAEQNQKTKNQMQKQNQKSKKELQVEVELKRAGNKLRLKTHQRTNI